MAIVTMSYAICDTCGIPASEPVDGGFYAARIAAPKKWMTVGGDFCPAHRPPKEEQ